MASCSLYFGFAPARGYSHHVGKTQWNEGLGAMVTRDGGYLLTYCRLGMGEWIRTGARLSTQSLQRSTSFNEAPYSKGSRTMLPSRDHVFQHSFSLVQLFLFVGIPIYLCTFSLSF